MGNGVAQRSDMAEPGLEVAATLPMVPMQPRPERTRVVYYRTVGRTITAIMRRWRPGDTARCQLCSQCRAYDDGCLMVFPRKIPKDEAPLASSRGYRQVEPNSTAQPVRVVS